MQPRRLIFRDHATRRMMERRVRVADIRSIIEDGEIVEDYPNDFPHHSRLLLGWIKGRPLHVVVADHPSLLESSIITVYEPDPQLWEPDCKTRRPT